MDYDAKDLKSVLLYMRGQFGADAFEDAPRMFSILLDLAPGLRRDGNVLRQMSDAGLLRELRTASETGEKADRERVALKSRHWLGDDYLTLANERVDYFMTALQAVYGLELEPPKPQAQPVTPAPQPITPQAPPQPVTPSAPSQPQAATPKPAPPIRPRHPVTIVDSRRTGDCGWTMYGKCFLKIFGYGKMADYVSRKRPPWNDNIRSVILQDGVTRIGDRAFCDCKSLTSVHIPDSVTQIGDRAFLRCESLASVNLPDSVTQIDDYAFYFCESLTSVNIPNSVTRIGNNAFQNCFSLTSVQIPDSVTQIGAKAFWNCLELKSVSVPVNAVIARNAFGRSLSFKKPVVIRR